MASVPLGSDASRGRPSPAVELRVIRLFPELEPEEITLTPASGRPEFSVAATAHDGQMLVTVRGPIDVRNAPELDAAIATSLRRHPYTLVVDLSAVTFMDSSACRSLLQARGDAIRSAVELELRGITDSCRRALQGLELDKLFTFTSADDDGT